MDETEFPDYVQKIRIAQENTSNLNILAGLECEIVPEYYQYYKQRFLDEFQLDYLCGSVHFYPINGQWNNVYGEIRNKKELFAYTSTVINGIESGLFDFIAHPDLFANCYFTWDENTKACCLEIAKASKEFNVPLEINGYGFRKPYIKVGKTYQPSYPSPKFWHCVAKISPPVIINSDAHNPQDIVANIDQCFELAHKNRLKNNFLIKRS